MSSYSFYDAIITRWRSIFDKKKTEKFLFYLLQITWIDGVGNVLTSGVEYRKELMPDNKRFEARSILKLIPKREHHNTTITCQALNSADRQEKTAKLRLTVKFAPKVTVSVISGALANEKIPEGTEVRLACQAEANPSNDLTYRWYINGEPAIGDFTTEMMVPNISRKYHDAVIKCEVQNSVGKNEESETLEIRYGPAFRSPLKSIEADEGDTVTLACDVDGNPTPDVEWIFNPSSKVMQFSKEITFHPSNDSSSSCLYAYMYDNLFANVKNCNASLPFYKKEFRKIILKIYCKEPLTYSIFYNDFKRVAPQKKECIRKNIPKSHSQYM